MTHILNKTKKKWTIINQIISKATSNMFFIFFFMIKKRIYHYVLHCIWPIKKKTIFFSSFIFNMVQFPQKLSYESEIHRKDTLGSKSENCRRNHHKNQHLLILWDFGKFFDFPLNLCFMRLICEFFLIVGNRQTEKIKMILHKKFMF